MKSAIWIAIVVALVAAIVAGFLLSTYKTPPTSETTPPSAPEIIPETEETPPETPTTPIEETVEVKEFTVEGSEFKFSPASITVNKDDAIKIIFKNIGSTRHNLVISELGVSTKTISSGRTDTIEFTADKTGTFSFYCSISGHRAAGMEGKLEVS